MHHPQSRYIEHHASDLTLTLAQSLFGRKQTDFYAAHVEADKANTDRKTFTLILARSRLDAFVTLEDTYNRVCHDGAGKALAETSSWT